MKATVGWILLAASLLAGCENTHTLPPLNDITRLEARSNMDSLGVIVDTKRVAAVVAFINARRDNWRQPWAGVPVGNFGVTFFAGTKVRGSFKSGSGFFECYRDGDWFSRDATPSEIAEWRALLAPY